MTAAHAAPEEPEVEAEAGKHLTYHGEKFRIHPDGVSEFAQLELAEMITSGGDGSSYKDQAAILRLVIDAVHEDDELRFRAACRKHRATVDELMRLIQDGTAGDERPFEERSDFSAGPTSTPQRSASGSDATVTPLHGRPDLEHIVRMQDQAASA